MQLHYIGHSAVELSGSFGSLLIDPFITGNPVASAEPEALNPSHIILTHAHGDHIGDTESIARRCGAVVVSSFEIVNYFSARGIAGHGMNPGGGHQFPFGHVKFTPAWHSSSFPDGTYGGMPMGVVLELDGLRLYHAGDTALFGDMALIGRAGLDLALLPIGDNYTMGPDDALEAVRLLKPKRLVPIHYNTFDLIRQDAAAFKRRVELETDAECLVLQPGESTTL